MRIAFITYEYPPDTGKGGIGTYTVQMTSLLIQAGHEVHVFCGSLNRSGTEMEDRVIVHRVLCTGVVNFRNAVIDVFSAEHSITKFDMIESPEINSNAALIKEKFPDLPLIVKIHAPNQLVESLKRKYLPFWNKARYTLGGLRRWRWDLGYWKKYNHNLDTDYRFVMKADVVIAPTNVMKQWIVRHWNLAIDRVLVVPNPIIINPEWQVPSPEYSTNTVLFYGRLNVLKGLITATHAMTTILRNNPEWKWKVVGDDGAGPNGNDSMEVWMQKQLVGVENRVEFHCGVAHETIPSFLTNADIVIIPSLFESFSYVCVESMTAGKAIVGSKGTGIASLIDDRLSGLLANPYKPEEWIEQIQFLISNPMERTTISNKASHAIKSLCEKNEEILSFYKTICKQLNQTV